MTCPIFEVHAQSPQPRTIARASALLEAGELLAYPTDTSYALGCDLSNKQAIQRLHRLKALPKGQPMALLVPDLSEVARYAKVSNFGYRILKHLAPGPFTFILDATRLVPELMLTRQKTVGIRLPDAPVACALARALGRPLVTTTAGVHGEAAFPSAHEVREHFGHGLGLILDVDALHGEDSTILSLVGDELALLRQGKGDASSVL